MVHVDDDVKSSQYLPHEKDNTRSAHTFSKRSYTSGIVLVECPGCKNRCALLLLRSFAGTGALTNVGQTSHRG